MIHEDSGEIVSKCRIRSSPLFCKKQRDWTNSIFLLFLKRDISCSNAIAYHIWLWCSPHIRICIRHRVFHHLFSCIISTVDRSTSGQFFHIPHIPLTSSAARISVKNPPICASSRSAGSSMKLEQSIAFSGWNM